MENHHSLIPTQHSSRSRSFSLFKRIFHPFHKKQIYIYRLCNLNAIAKLDWIPRPTNTICMQWSDFFFFMALASLDLEFNPKAKAWLHSFHSLCQLAFSSTFVDLKSTTLRTLDYSINLFPNRSSSSFELTLVHLPHPRWAIITHDALRKGKFAWCEAQKGSIAFHKDWRI